MKSLSEEYVTRRSTKSTNPFKNEDGAIDLSSIMVGVLVIGLIGGVIAATVFAVIPWAQDNAARQQLDPIVQAENAYFGLSSTTPSSLPEGYSTNSFSDSIGLASAGLLPTNSRYCVVATSGGKGYQGFSASNTGSIWSVSESNSVPTKFTDALPTACEDIASKASATPTPPPVATRPADSNAPGMTITSNGGYPAYWPDKTVSAWASNASASFGFSMTGVSNATQAANYTVTFTGGENIGAATYTQSPQTGNGYMWMATVRPVAGGFTEGIGYITATVTDKATGAVSKKTWSITVVAQSGPVQGNYYSSYWTDKTAPNSTSNSTAVFGFRIPFAKASDYTVTYSGAANIGAVANTVSTSTVDNGGTDWYSVITPTAGAGGYTTGTGVITATVKYNPTGKTWTKNFNLTVVDTPGPVPGNYYASHWGNKTAVAGGTGSAVFGFAIKGAISSDFAVTFTSTGSVNENISATQFSNADGADWYTVVTPKTGGYTAGTSTITATATSRSTGKVFTKTYTFTVS